MQDKAHRAVAIVGVGAVLPDAPNAPTFWKNIKDGRYSITEVQPDRWDSKLYYDPDPKAPDKSYSKIGGWVREWDWDPLKWGLPIPPRVGANMDLTQKWAVVATREALNDYGYPKRTLDAERTAVILGNAMGGDMHLYSTTRLMFPEFADELSKVPSFSDLPTDVRETILGETYKGVAKRLPEINEDTMPGELANIAAGRIAALFNFRGPNYIADAACASAMAAFSAAVEGLEEHDFDAAITGGVDSNMAPSIYTKFCKIGALTATGSRPYADGADGFVMGEGAAVFLIKRLSDAERDGDKIYAIVRGIGGSSDGRGKGITAPNPVGQKLAVQRAWQDAGLSPSAGDMIEGHGTSTRVGDLAEVESLQEAFAEHNLPVGSVALGSVKSNIGHLKGAAAAAGILKAAYSLHEKVLPPSINFHKPNSGFDFANSPFLVNTKLRPWEANKDGVRRVGVSAFGFGGTNFHAVFEEYVPGRITYQTKTRGAAAQSAAPPSARAQAAAKMPLRGALVIGADSEAGITERLVEIKKEAEAGRAPATAAPTESSLRAPVRLAIDYGNAAELADKATRALKALEENQHGRWKALRAKGIFLGRGPAPKVAFLFTGQGSQYVNMLDKLRRVEPIVADTYAEADRVMKPLLEKPLTEYIFLDESDKEAIASAEEDLKQTVITQPAVLATETALARLMGAYGVSPDMVMGHSLGEYGALVASGALPFADGLTSVSRRGSEMTKASGEDDGKMAAVHGPIEEVQKILATIDGYVEVANINSTKEAVIGGVSKAVEDAMVAVREAGYTATQIPVSHAFHTKVVGAASQALYGILEATSIQSPSVPVVANITGDFYPMGPGVVPEMIDILARQVASPVQFVKGLRKLYDAGVRLFIELGPKRALYGFASDVLGEHEDAAILFTNHPRIGDIESFNQALCGLYAAGLGVGEAERVAPEETARVSVAPPAEAGPPPVAAHRTPPAPTAAPPSDDRYVQLGHLFAEFLDRGFDIYSGEKREARTLPIEKTLRPVCVTGASLGLPGVDGVFDDTNVERILRGDQFIGAIPMEMRRAMADKGITRLVKSEEGDARFETIDDADDVVKLAGRCKEIDLVGDFGFPEDRMPALDLATKLAIGAGLDALRDAGIPMVLRYKTTTKGTKLPDGWELPEDMRDDTGVIFASAFPGFDSFAGDMSRYYDDRGRRERLTELEDLRDEIAGSESHDDNAVKEIENRIADLQAEIEKNPHQFNRRFLFTALAMGHTQFAQYIGARGPNTQVNAACASATIAASIARDWIRAGRCRRVIVISADNVASDNLMEWFGSGFLASGAAATDENVEDAAIPFDRRRHGLIIGMGGAGLVLEDADSAHERGIQPICDVLGSISANSAFHGTRLDVDHICGVMEKLVSKAEEQWGINRNEIAPQMVFVSHETYTPARGGSAAAEVFALRHVFGQAADQIVVANTKGFTGHPMGVGIEDAIAVKILETGIVPPVPNFKEVDPELGQLNLSKGGSYPVKYALRLAAGFGSQISMVLTRWTPTADGQRRRPDQLGYDYRIADQITWNNWLNRITGYEKPELEVVKRTLRLKDQGHTVQLERPGAAPPAGIPAREQVAAAPAQTQPAPVPVTAAPATTERNPVQEKVLEIVAEKSGYPPDMLDLDLDLEADLGIDTVKQAEMFAAVREAYDIPRDDDLKLRDFPTLAHTVQFVFDHRPDLKQTVATAPEPETAALGPAPAIAETVAAGDDQVRETVLRIISEKTGYPIDMLDVDLDLEADLGIDTVKQAEMFAAIRESYDIPRDDDLKLRDFPTLAHTIQFVYDRRPDLAGQAKPAATTATQPAAQPEPEAPAATGAAAATDDSVKNKVLEIIAEKTGYPVDMLDLDLDLEADLGIDTVKQAEMFASIREAYDIPRDDDLKLRDFPTLAHTIQFVYDRRPDLAGGTASVSKTATVTEEVTEPVAGARDITGDMDAANEVPRRVPAPFLRPPLELCKPTGVTLDSQSRVIVVPDRGGVGKALIGRLETLGATTLVIDDAPDAETLTERIETWKSEGPISGVFWLPALDNDNDVFAASDLSQWREATRLRVKLLYATARALYDQYDKSGTFLVAATRLGGQHGYDDEGAIYPLGGAVAGFTKAFKREKGSALVKVVDFEASRKTAAFADLIIDETLRDPGVVEVGYKKRQRWTIGLEQKPGAGGETTSTGVELNKDSVFVVTGAAGSIVSAITADLADASGGTFYLLDLAPKPDPNDADIQRFETDKEGLKREIFERFKAEGDRATPAMVEKEIAVLERSHAALTAISAIEKAGGSAHYHSVDLLDGGAVAKIMQEIAAKSGRIDVLVHAAGLEISHMLPDKKPGEFDLVFDVKSDGWFNIMSNLGETPLGAAVVFSSIAGRFGNAGQTDYSAANDLLCKSISNFKTTRPDTIGIAIDWTAWGGIGMAARGSIPTIMKQAGIDMLQPQAGIPVIRRELTSGDRGEVIIAERLGIMLEEFDETGGLDTSEGGKLAESLGSNGVMAGKLVGMGLYTGLTVETTLDPAEQPFLHDHQINDTPVLPGVMGIEALVEAAKLIFPDRYLSAIEDVNFLVPFKFYRSEPRTVTVHADFTQEGGEVVAHCRLIGSRELHGKPEPEVTTHFTARVRLSTKPPRTTKRKVIAAKAEGKVVGASDIYRLYFHGPAYQVVENSWRAGKEIVGLYAGNLPANHEPADRPTLTAPRLIELCFQTAGIFELAGKARMGLPYQIDQVKFLRSPETTKNKLLAAVTSEPDGAFDAQVVDEKGEVYMTLRGYRTAELPDSIEAELLKPLKDVME